MLDKISLALKKNCQLKVNRVWQINHRGLNQIFEAQTEIGNLLVKLSQQGLRQVAWFKFKLANEAAALAFARKAGLPVAKVIYQSQADQFVPYPYLVLSKLPGQPLTIAKLSPQQISNLASQIVFLLQNCYQIKFQNFGLFLSANNLPTETSWLNFLLKQLSPCLTFLSQQKILSASQTKLILEKFTAQKDKTLNLKTGSLLMGDLKTNHFLINSEKKITGLIDWEFARSGDPLFDLIYWQELDQPNKILIDEFLCHFKPAVSQDLPQIEYYRLFILAQKSVASLRAKLPDKKLIAKFTDLIIKFSKER